MAFLTLEDTTGSAEVIVYPKIYGEYSGKIQTEEPVIIRGSAVIRSDEEPKIVCDDIMHLSDVPESSFSKIYIRIPDGSKKEAERLKNTVSGFRGEFSLSIYLSKENKYVSPPPGCEIDGSYAAVEVLKKEYGEKNVILK